MKYIKTNIKTLEDKLSKLKEEQEYIKDIIELRDKNIIVINKEFQKFKKYPSIFVDFVYDKWSEGFVDKDNGEVIYIDRHECIGVLLEGKAYKTFYTAFNDQTKTINLHVDNYSEVLTNLINKKL